MINSVTLGNLEIIKINKDLTKKDQNTAPQRNVESQVRHQLAVSPAMTADHQNCITESGIKSAKLESTEKRYLSMNDQHER